MTLRCTITTWVSGALAVCCYTVPISLPTWMLHRHFGLTVNEQAQQAVIAS